VHGVHQTYCRHRNHFGCMMVLGDEAQVDARFGLFGDSASLGARFVQVCVEHIVG
jgi:hypothetical protein